MIKAGTLKDGLEGSIWSEISLLVQFNWRIRGNQRKWPSVYGAFDAGKFAAQKQIIEWLRKDVANV